MAGTLLSPDQVRKLNASFPALVNHIRTLLAADHSGVGLMRVHSQVESFDSDEMVRIFREVNFVTPLEKKALVRAAIYELLAREPALFVSPEAPKLAVVGVDPAAPGKDKTVSLAVFVPTQFKLNVATSGAEETAKTDTKPEPKVTSTFPAHTSKVAESLKVGDKAQAEQKIELEKAVVESKHHVEAQQAKLEAAVAKLREANVPKVVDPLAAAEATAMAPLIDKMHEVIDEVVETEVDAPIEE